MRMDIVIAGVGGQGTVLASRVIAQAALDAGLAVRTSETIGMAQREGTVTSHVRIGEPLYGALIPDGSADVLLGFEMAETARWLHKLKPGGTVLANSARIIPVSVASGRSKYEADTIMEYLRSTTDSLTMLDATELAIKAGNYRATNTVLLGAMSTLPCLPFKSKGLLSALLETIPAKLRDINSRAFELGRQAVEV